LEHMNYDNDSPLAGLIRTPTTPEGIIKDNSVLRMLENSLYDGALYHFRDPETGEGDARSMLRLVKEYWTAVMEAFPEAWGLPPRRSRLMHGVGIVSLGFVMDAIADEHLPEGSPGLRDFAAGLARVVPVCRWTSGDWHFARDHLRRWNHLQNTPKDIQLLTDHLLSEYRRASPPTRTRRVRARR
jgi:hypothetical protein